MIVGEPAEAAFLEKIEPAVADVADGELVVAKNADEQCGGHSALGGVL